MTLPARTPPRPRRKPPTPVLTTTGARELNRYLDAIHGPNAQGWAVMATGHAGRPPEKREWVETSFEWPAERRQLVNALLTAAELQDVWLCPYLFAAGKRTKGTAVSRRLIHADIDSGFDAAALAKVDDLGGFAIGSGSPGHAHVYVPLNATLRPETHEALCIALGEYVGGDAADRAKHSDNDMLRPAGTTNRKGAGAVGAVHWLGTRPARAASLKAVRAELSPWLPAAQLALAPLAVISTGVVAVEFDLADHPDVARAIANNTGDRSTDCMRIVAAVVDAGLTLGHARHAVALREDLAGRLAGRKDDDVAQCWAKIDADRRRQVTIIDNGATTAGAEFTHRSQLGMAHRLATAQGVGADTRLMYVHGVGWHSWDGTRWALDETGAAALRAVSELLKAEWQRAFTLDTDTRKEILQDITRCETAAGLGGVLKLAESLPEFAVTVNDLDVDPYLFNCANGTLDLRTMELLKHDPADRITKVARAAYDLGLGAAEGDWSRFLNEILPTEAVADYLCRVCGVALVGKVLEQTLTMLVGETANGKGTFYLAMLFTFGDYADMANPDLFLRSKGGNAGSATPEDMALLGLRLAIVTETARGRAFDDARMKRLTGGDRIKARKLYHNEVSFAPSHTPLMITNHEPRVSADDPAVWRRLHLVPFDVTIPEEKRNKLLGDALAADCDAILAWCVRGWADYVARGYSLDEPEQILKRTEQYRDEHDDIAAFIEERCVTTSPLLQSITSKLYEAYQDWCRGAGLETSLTRKGFGKMLDRKGFPADDAARTAEGRWRPGISLRPESRTDPDD